MRRALFSLAAAFLLGVAASFLILRARKVPPALEPLPQRSPFDRMPSLADVSVWRLDSTKRGGRSGAFAIGNGAAFAILGLSRPVNTLENIIGPSYQKRAGFLGRWEVALERRGRPISLPDWVAARLRGTAVVVTRERGKGVALYTVNFAPFTKGGLRLPALMRLVWVANESREPLKGLVLRHKLQGMRVERIDKKHGLVLLAHGGIKMAFGTVGVRPKVEGGDVIVKLPKIPPGSSVRMLSFLAVGRCSPRRLDRALEGGKALPSHPRGILLDEAGIAEILRGGDKLLSSTVRWWRRWRNGGLRIRTPDERVDDFLDTALVLCKAQQGYLGAFSPMHGYTFYWIRDANGPIRLFLICGLFDDVDSCLRYHSRVCSRLRKVPNAIPLGLDVPDWAEGVDWSKVEVPRAEIASFVVLQHVWYWRATGEVGETLRKSLPMLERCIFGQELRPDGRLPFHGDETYRFPGYFFFEQTRKFPTDYVHLSTLSADSAFEFVAACEGLAEIERELGRERMADRLTKLADFVRGATERFYWREDLGFYAPASSPLSSWQVHPVPFANINLRPLWVGYLDPDDPKAIRNVLTTVSVLSRGDGMIKTTPTFGYYVGMVPGYLLYNLAALDHPAAEAALEALLRAATPTGEFCEMHLPDDRPATRKLWGYHHLRPWETGINAEAVVFYLLGIRQDAPHRTLELCPRLPFGWTEMEAEGIRCGDSLLSLEVRDFGSKRVYKIRCEEGAEPLEIVFRLSLPARRIVKVSLDGRPAPFVKWRQFGREGGLLKFEIEPGRERVVVAVYVPDRSPAKPIPPKPLKQPRSGPPAAKAVVVTGDPKLVERYRKRYGSVVALDPRLYLPKKWIVKAFSEAKLVVFDDVLPGPFKPPDFWEKPEIRRALEKAKRRGAKVIYLKRPKAREFTRLKGVEEEVRSG